MINQHTDLWTDLFKWLNSTANDFYAVYSNGLIDPYIIQVCEPFGDTAFSLAPNENFKFYLEKQFPRVDFDKVQYEMRDIFIISSRYGSMITIKPLDNEIIHLAYIKYPEVSGK